MKHLILILTGLEVFAFNSNAQTNFADPRDGKVYKTVTIGLQVWMAENLAYLPNVEGSVSGSNSSPFYYVYGYNGTSVTDAKATGNYASYGVLYNWSAAMAGSASSTANPSGVQGVCPTGWHLPSDAEWTQLITYIGGQSVAGGKLKETGTTHWLSPNTGATNETGFTSRPGGYRLYDGAFYDIGYFGYWWNATESSASVAWSQALGYASNVISRGADVKQQGYSVRCVRDSVITKVEGLIEQIDLQVYPNPTIDRVTINVFEIENAKMRIFDMGGKCVLAGELRNGTNDIDVSMLTKGIYLFQLSGNSQNYHTKLIKK